MEMKQVSVQRTAIQYDGRREHLPKDWHIVRPEITWSHGRELVYFGYGDLLGMMGHWMGVATLDHRPATDGFESFLEIDKAGRTYWRKAFSFTMWDVKSEAQIARRNGQSAPIEPTFADPEDQAVVELLKDFILLENWIERAPELRDNIFGLNMVEFREFSGAYGRGYAPHYLRPGDWLVEGAKPGCTSTCKWHVVAADEFGKAA